MDEESVFYPCHICGYEIEMGRCMTPLTASQWVDVQRRLLERLSCKLDNHREVVYLLTVNKELANVVSENVDDKSKKEKRMDDSQFEYLIHNLRNQTFHMSNREATPIVDEFLKEHPDLLEKRTRDWFIQYC